MPETVTVHFAEATMMRRNALQVAWSCLAIVFALYIVGAVSHGLLRHIVQTLPLWIPIALGLRARESAKWAALPCLIFWLAIMSFIWLFLLHLAHIVSGHFSPTEIAMTIIVGTASLIGLWAVSRWRTATGPVKAMGIALFMAAFQLLALRISLLPSIAYR